MSIVLFNLLKSKVGQLALVGLVGLGVGAYTHKRLTPPRTTTQVVHDTQQVRVDVPVLTEKVITQIITDPKQQDAISRVVKENNELKLRLTQISSTIATNTSSGSNGTGTMDGKITPSPEPTPQGVETSSHFEDWQLKADYSKERFVYGLTQTFIIESSTGRDGENRPVGITRLFQQSPNGLLPIPAQTITIAANPDRSRWLISPRGQIGLALDQDKAKAGVIAFQWLKHGSSTDPKDIRWALFSPAIFVSSAPTQLGILPVSLNLGSFRHDPLSNLWISASIDKTHKLGIVLSMTF